MRIVFTFTVILALFLYHPAASQICINEYLPGNLNGILDEDGDYFGWVELYNNSPSPINIAGYGLSDDLGNPLRWTLPSAMIPAGEHLLVFTSGKDRKQVPMKFETIIDIGDEWKYYIPNSNMGISWRDPDFDDSSWESGSSGFGYADNDDSTIISSSAFSLFVRKEFNLTDVSEISRLILCVDYDDGFVAYINGHEVARANLGNPGENTPWNQVATTWHEAVMYSGGKPDYFEISNIGNILKEGSNLIAIQIHNNVINSTDMTLNPFLTVGRMSGVHQVSKWLSFSTYGGLHTNFKVKPGKERLYLSNPSGVIYDSTGYAGIIPDVSFGCSPDGSGNNKYFAMPSPGSKNVNPANDFTRADSVIVSPAGGLYLSGTSVTLTTASASNDSIYYTLDGSVPDSTDNLYKGPVFLSKSSVIRARAIRHGKIPGPVSTRTFITGLDHDVPVISLSTDPFNLWDNLSGIYAFGPNTPTQSPYFEANFWKDWERPVHMELYDTDGVLQIDQLAGVKIFGAYSRAQPQKSFALFARKEYGKGSFKYPFFKTKSIDKFESVILRNSGNDNMGLHFHDCFMTGLAREMDVDIQAYQPAAVYLNGEYWGLLNIREKVSEHYIEGNHQVEADSVNLLEYDGNIINGENTGYAILKDFMNQKTTLQNDGDFKIVQDQVDIDNFIQYQILNIYLNNRDWPGNNIKFWNTNAPGSKWRWIAYDTDFGFGIWDENDYKLNTLEFALDPAGPSWPNPPWSTLFLRRMVTNTGFRNNFINQFCDRLNQDFNPERVRADLDSLQALYTKEIQYTFNRWDSSYDDWLCNYSGWLWRIGSRKVFAANRPAYCRQHLLLKFQLSSQLNIAVDVSDKKAGVVKLNSIYVHSYPFNGIYFKNIPVTMKAIPAPGYKFTGWSGTMTSAEPEITYNMSAAGNFKANFKPALPEDISIVINEINYKSSERLDTKDWIELYNNGAATIDLSGWLLVDSNIDSGFVFPAGTTMIPGSYLVICRDVKDLRAYHPNVKNSIGELPFKLSSDGDIVRLFDNNNVLVDAVNFGTSQPWPVDANGSGKTIELRNPLLDNSRPENWQASIIGGTPGAKNSPDTTTVDIEQPFSEMTFECFPNPFRDFTTIRFKVNSEDNYRLEVIDLQGKKVRVLHEGILRPDSYWIDWDGEGPSDKGVYIIRLTSSKGIQNLKVVKL